MGPSLGGVLLPAVASAPSGLTLYCFSVGLVAAVNPCGFPMLPAYLTLSSSDEATTPLPVRIVRALGSGAAVTLGFVVVFTLIGVLAKAGASVAFGWLPWVMVPIGVACFAIGLWTVVGRALKLPVPSRRLFAGRRRGVALFGFGVTYAVASLACAFPLFLGPVVGSFAQRGVLAGLLDGLAYALGMGLVICAVSLAGVGAQQLRLRSLRRAQPVLQRIAGAVLCLIGGYLVLYWVNDLVSPTHTPRLVNAVEGIQTTVQSWLSASPRLTGAVIGAIVLVALLAAGARIFGRRGPTGDTATGTGAVDPPTVGGGAPRAEGVHG